MADDDASAPEPQHREPAEPSASEPSVSEAFAEAARRSALGHVKPGEAPTGAALLGAMGGVRGLIESIVPGLVFVVVFTILTKRISDDLVIPISVLAPGVVALVFIVVRLVQRQPVTTAVAGLFGVIISAILSIVTGRASNNFLLGFGIDAVLAVVMIVSLLARRPLIGLLAGLLTGDAAAWRDDPAKRRVAFISTILWAAFPLARLVAQVPLYLADQTAVLGIVKLAMGVPLYAGVVWVSWLMLRSAWTPGEQSGDDSGAASADDAGTR
jgi:hypothetical protein